jgi:hypothetical protein
MARNTMDWPEIRWISLSKIPNELCRQPTGCAQYAIAEQNLNQSKAAFEGFTDDSPERRSGR